MVRDGDIITGGGVTAGIDFALVVAAELAGDSPPYGYSYGYSRPSYGYGYGHRSW